MITFAAGPSKVYESVAQYLQDAYNEGILSANHRSSVFMNLYQETETLFKEKLNVPADYRLLFTSSATENWEIISQSLVVKSSFHIYSGSFGKKWFEFARHIHPHSIGLTLELNEVLDVSGVDVPDFCELIAITQNETSNATEVNLDILADLRRKYPEKLIAVDTTSSMGGIALDFMQADIWYASVQKCFGLPAGLGMLILAPKAIEKVQSIEESGRYNSLTFMLENAKTYQTHYTPNVLGIYLLYRVLKDIPEIQHTDKKAKERIRVLEHAIASSTNLRLLVNNEASRSKTVLGVSGKEEFIKELKKSAEKEGIKLGEGYGPLKASSFRIANFPAITDQEFQQLITFLKKY
jgi:phosphoserine aminotransferase